MIEYVLIAAVVCVVMVAGMKKLGKGYLDIYNKIGNGLDKDS